MRLESTEQPLLRDEVPKVAAVVTTPVRQQTKTKVITKRGRFEDKTKEKRASVRPDGMRKWGEKGQGAAENVKRRKQQCYFCNEDGHTFQAGIYWKAWVAEDPKRKGYCAICAQGPHKTDTCREPQGAFWGKTPIATKRDNVVALITRPPIIGDNAQLGRAQEGVAQQVERTQRAPTPESEYERALMQDPAATAILSAFPFASQNAPQVAEGNCDLALGADIVLRARGCASVCGQHGGCGRN